jgi:DNA-binding GntR family transcriptional regulator
MKDVLQKVNSQDPTPKYVQAREILLGAIRSGRLLPGSKLPSTAELSRVFDVSLITAHRALEGLVETGWLRRVRPRGL